MRVSVGVNHDALVILPVEENEVPAILLSFLLLLSLSHLLALSIRLLAPLILRRDERPKNLLIPLIQRNPHQLQRLLLGNLALGVSDQARSDEVVERIRVSGPNLKVRNVLRRDQGADVELSVFLLSQSNG